MPIESVNVPDDDDEAPEITCDNCMEPVESEDDLFPVIVRLRDLFHGQRVAHWCRSCENDHSVYCTDLSAQVDEGAAERSLYYYDSDGEWHTVPEESDDYDEDGCDVDDSGLFGYSTNILRIHGWPNRTPRNSLCFGVELEMESRSRSLHSDMLELLRGRRGNGRYILKYDGSLDEGKGAELVTQPFTLADHQKHFGWDKILSDKLRDIARSGSGTTNCGLHVHVNRAALTPLTIGKLLVFLNHPNTSRLVTTVAQRSSNGMCQRDEKKKATSERSGYHCRYDILNVGNTGTVEFRMFRGNLRPERVLKAVEFCHALVMFCQDISLTDADDAGKFLSYVSKRGKEYPHLVSFLIEKTLLPRPSTRSTAPYAAMARMARAEA